MWILLFMMVSGLLSFCFSFKHFLLMLISLEWMMLTLFLMIFYSYMMLNYEFYFMLYFLVFMVCEGVLGLSILVNIVRTHSNDYISCISVLKW
uniref:NADH-ubiquinone oxidoreductase chain 4L n=1 Tax=Megaris sp. TaxID=2931300 RepID=A0A8T9ZXD8_9HEMI|nr:NADH dehydrogenase subunit 4L [Megaris sp.]